MVRCAYNVRISHAPRWMTDASARYWRAADCTLRCSVGRAAPLRWISWSGTLVPPPLSPSARVDGSQLQRALTCVAAQFGTPSQRSPYGRPCTRLACGFDSTVALAATDPTWCCRATVWQSSSTDASGMGVRSMDRQRFVDRTQTAGARSSKPIALVTLPRTRRCRLQAGGYSVSGSVKRAPMSRRLLGGCSPLFRRRAKRLPRSEPNGTT